MIATGKDGERTGCDRTGWDKTGGENAGWDRTGWERTGWGETGHGWTGVAVTKGQDMVDRGGTVAVTTSRVHPGCKGYTPPRRGRGLYLEGSSGQAELALQPCRQMFFSCWTQTWTHTMMDGLRMLP